MQVTVLIDTPCYSLVKLEDVSLVRFRVRVVGYNKSTLDNRPLLSADVIGEGDSIEAALKDAERKIEPLRMKEAREKFQKAS